MREFRIAQVFFCSAFSFLVFSLGSQTETDKPVSNLTLQWEVSHPTGEHQNSLVFKTDRVDLFTNTSLWQGALTPRLGHFTSVLNKKWRVERERMDVYLSLLENNPPVNADQLLGQQNFPKGLAEFIQESSHAPVVRLNEYEMREEDLYFSALEGFFPLVWKNNRWTCVDCVIYRVRRKGIERHRISKDGTRVKKIFSREQLNCYPVDEKLLECTDTQGGPTGNGWGSFRIRL